MRKTLIKLLLMCFCVFNLVGCDELPQPTSAQQLSTFFSYTPLEVVDVHKSGVPTERIKAINLVFVNPETGYRYRYTEVVEAEGVLPRLWDLKEGAVVLAEIQLWKSHDTNELVKQKIYRILD